MTMILGDCYDLIAAEATRKRLAREEMVFGINYREVSIQHQPPERTRMPITGTSITTFGNFND